MARFGREVGGSARLVIGVIAALQLLSGAGAAEVFLLAVALAVSAIPEGLPVAMTIALSISVHRMSLKNVVVRHLPAVERSEEHTSELPSLMRISYAVFCFKIQTNTIDARQNNNTIQYNTILLHH